MRYLVALMASEDSYYRASPVLTHHSGIEGSILD